MELSPQQRAWAAHLYDANVDGIYSYLARRLGRERANDAVADVFEAAFGSLDSYDRARGTERAWLFGIANNIIRRHWRSEERRLRAWGQATHVDRAIDPLLDVVIGIDARSTSAAVMAAIAELAPVDRDLLLMVVWEEVSYSDCAASLDIPVGTVRSRLNRIRRHLRTAADNTPHEVTR